MDLSCGNGSEFYLLTVKKGKHEADKHKILTEAVMKYRLATERDIDVICRIVRSAVEEMESRGIFQWDSIYPAREDFLSDIKKNTLYTGMEDEDIAVIYTINKECDEQYDNGMWNYSDSEYRVIHRFCVHPGYQNRGFAAETLRHIENELREQGIETIRLDVFKNNPFALSLYRRCGYEEVGMARWRKGEFFLMEKHL